ncbi:hypothetical protein [Arthrobacter sp.]|uniref:hypothetical protein n=1 Tax=Arthrobacter sp. TaxID=1667 RepID=UPI003395A8B3
MNSTATLSPVVCAPWCEAGDGHTDATLAEDQICFGESLEIQLPATDTVAPDTLELYPAQSAGGAVEVRLSHNGGAGPALALADVERLRDGLTAILAAHAAELLPAA